MVGGNIYNHKEAYILEFYDIIIYLSTKIAWYGISKLKIYVGSWSAWSSYKDAIIEKE